MVDLYLGPDCPAANGVYGDIALYNGIYMREIAGREGEDTPESGSAQRVWLVYGDPDPLVCRTALLAGPIDIRVYDGMNLVSLTRRLMVNEQAWEFTATYDRITPSIAGPSSLGYTVSIDTTGATILQTTSYAQTKYAISGKVAPDFLKSIDVQDGAPLGVERIIPALKITVKAKISGAYISSAMAYAKIVAGLTGTTNNAAMFGGEFAIGELLFAGASGPIVADDPQLDFIFLASKNVTGLEIGGITGISKKGHEYMWFLFDAAKDATTGMLIHKPRACYIDQIYGPGDHTLLNIGVAPP